MHSNQIKIDTRPEPNEKDSVSYFSRGHLLVIGWPGRTDLLQNLPASFHTTLLINDAGESDTTDTKPFKAIFFGEVSSLKGHLGHYQVVARLENEMCDLGKRIHPDTQRFDLIIDLSNPPVLTSELLPPGYFAPRNEEELKKIISDTLPELVGEFEKPRFFEFDEGLCARGGTETTGCERCIEVCSPQAITTGLHKISVDPWLCQGCGVCSTVCPSGAIRYNYPEPRRSLQLLRDVLEPEKVGASLVNLIVYNESLGREGLQSYSNDIKVINIAMNVEEVSSLGGDFWLSALCYGADRIILIDPEQMPAKSRDSLRREVKLYNTLLAGLGYGEERLILIPEADLDQLLSEPPVSMAIKPAAFNAFNDKRTLLDLAITHLYEQASSKKRFQDLPSPSPFGAIRVDQEGCTLCMSCVNVCPSKALQDGHNLPRLAFIEANCVQCGACAEACPEQVIELKPRIDYDRTAAKELTLMKEDEPFLCRQCHKPFATTSMITRIQEKLANHWMYQSRTDRDVMLLCGECRMKHMFTHDHSARITAATEDIKNG